MLLEQHQLVKKDSFMEHDTASLKPEANEPDHWWKLLTTIPNLERKQAWKVDFHKDTFSRTSSLRKLWSTLFYTFS